MSEIDRDHAAEVRAEERARRMSNTTALAGLTKEDQIDLAWAQHRAWLQQQESSLCHILPSALRDRLAEQQNWRCCYCGVRMDGKGDDPDAPTFEHVVPRSIGGANDPSNLVIACRQCNGKRASQIWDVHETMT
jgi:hypothetical protein